MDKTKTISISQPFRYDIKKLRIGKEKVSCEVLVETIKYNYEKKIMDFLEVARFKVSRVKHSTNFKSLYWNREIFKLEDYYLMVYALKIYISALLKEKFIWNDIDVF